MVQNTYICKNHEKVISGLIESNGFLEGCEYNIMQYVSNSDTEGLKSFVEHIWQQELKDCQINKLVEQIKKGNLEQKVKSWVEYYKNYYTLGFTPYIID